MKSAMKLLTPLLLMLTSLLSGQLLATPLKVGVSFAIPLMSSKVISVALSWIC